MSKGVNIENRVPEWDGNLIFFIHSFVYSINICYIKNYPVYKGYGNEQDLFCFLK